MSVERGSYGEYGPRRAGDYMRYEPYRSRPQHLTPSRELGPEWEVVAGPDIAGWGLVDPEGNGIGTVEDVLVDKDTGHAVFAITRVGTVRGRGGRHTLIPVDLLYLNVREKQAMVPLSEETLRNAPEFTNRTVDVIPFYDFWDRWSEQRRATEGEEPGGYVVEEEVETLPETTSTRRIRRIYRRRIGPDEPPRI